MPMMATMFMMSRQAAAGRVSLEATSDPVGARGARRREIQRARAAEKRKSERAR